MNIIVQKTDFYLDDVFFNEIINDQGINGVSFNIVFNKEHEILIYNYTSSIPYMLQKIQNVPLQNLEQGNILYLKDALTKIQRNRSDLLIYLNIIPYSINIIDESTLQQISNMNQEYTAELNELLELFHDLNISVHSVSRSLILLMQQKIPTLRVGMIVDNSDLTPADVDYYVFPTYMIDDNIFEELIRFNKGILIFISDENDLAVITKTYNSPESTAFSQTILPYLSFMANHSILIQKIFQ